ncbi:MAG: hypothetical protein RI897_4622 [Verrucomicrobiota bacterium]
MGASRGSWDKRTDGWLVFPPVLGLLGAEAFDDEDGVEEGEEDTDEAGELAEEADDRGVDGECGEEEEDSGVEEGGGFEGADDGGDTEAEGYTDMAVSDLGGIDDFGFASPSVVEGEEGIGEDHEPAGEPSGVLAEGVVILLADPDYQSVDAIVDVETAEEEEEEVEGEEPVEWALFADVGFEDIVDVEALPEEEEGDEDDAVVTVELAVLAEGPGDTGEEEDGGEGEEDGEFIEALGGDFLFFAVGFSGAGVGGAPEDGGEAEEERHIGDVIDDGVFDDDGGVQVWGAVGEDSEDEVTDTGAVGHD